MALSQALLDSTTARLDAQAALHRNGEGIQKGVDPFRGGADFVRGYTMRVGPRYLDARDPSGKLRLSNGTLVDVHGFTDADWAALSQRGVASEITMT